MVWIITFAAFAAGFGSVSLAPRPARAESQEMSAARNQQAKAYQDYYERLRHGGALRSEAKRKEAYEATVAPAQKALAESVSNEFRISAKNAYRHNRVRVESAVTKAGAKGGGGAPSPEPAKGRATPPPPGESYRPETVLDGSAVPRELDFSKRKK